MSKDRKKEVTDARVFSVYTMILSAMPLPGLLFFGIWIKKFSLEWTVHVISIFMMNMGFIVVKVLPKFPMKPSQETEIS